MQDIILSQTSQNTMSSREKELTGTLITSIVNKFRGGTA